MLNNKPTPQQLTQAAKECIEAQKHLEKLGLIKLYKNGNCQSTELGEDLLTMLELMNREYVLIEVKDELE